MIVFNNIFNENRVYEAYNNFILKYASDIDKVPIQSVLSYAGHTRVIYPSPDGFFWINMKEIASIAVNPNRFSDNLILSCDNHTTAYESGFYYAGDLEITILFSDNTTDYFSRQVDFYNGVSQHIDFINRTPGFFNRQHGKILLPFVDDTNISFYAKIWEGLPFDLQLFIGSTDSLFLDNTTTGTGFGFGDDFKAVRFCLSDGETNSNIEGYYPLAYGFNKIKGRSEVNDLSLSLEYAKCSPNGNYFKWQNSVGGWSYWLFETGRVTQSYKSRGGVFNDYYNLGDTMDSSALNYGQEASNTLQCSTGIITANQKNLIYDIFVSPKIYMYTGRLFSSAKTDWIEVKLNQGNQVIIDYKSKISPITISVDLPDSYAKQL